MSAPELVLHDLPYRIKVKTRPKNAQETIDFSNFVDWCAFQNIGMPVEAEVVAEYLVALLEDGNRLEDIRRVAASIVNSYKRRRCFVDLLLIEAALELCEAQLSPGRVLN